MPGDQDRWNLGKCATEQFDEFLAKHPGHSFQVAAAICRVGHRTARSRCRGSPPKPRRRTSNISIGGDAVDATDDVNPRHVDIVKAAAAALPGLMIAGFDVLVDGDDASILEINGSPMFSMHHFPWVGTPRDVISLVLDAMFPATAR